MWQVVLRKKDRDQVFTLHQRKRSFKKIKFQCFCLAVHIENIYDLPLFTRVLKFSYSALFKWRQAFMEIIKERDLGKIEEQTTRN